MKSIKPYFNHFLRKVNGKTDRHFLDLKRWQWMSSIDSEALQKRHLEDLLKHADLNVPYYRDVLRSAGVIKGDETVDLGCFDKIPFLTKDLIKTHYSDLKAPDKLCEGSYEQTSGGSTGEPARFIQDNRYKDWSRALTLLQYSWSGYERGQKRVLLWGSERDLFVGRETAKTRMVRCIKGEVWLNAFRMAPDQMSRFIEIINKYKPLSILAYADSIYEFAVFIEREKKYVHSPKTIMTSAGTLHPHMRETIERVFHAPVFNRYGTREFGNMACECEQHEGLHVSPQTHYVEILNQDGTPCPPGEAGELAVTLLSNYAMPLIRYKVGDLAAWKVKKCSCGRGWALLEKIIGRTTDIFVRKDGGVVPPEYFIHLLGVVFNRAWLKKFQVVQEDYEHVRVLMVLKNRTLKQEISPPSELKEIDKKIKLVMGDNCRVTFEFVDDIFPESSGKYRYVISKIER